MKLLFLLILSLFTSVQSFAQDIDMMIKEGNRLEFVPDEKAAFIKFKEALRVQPSNVYILNKCSELCSRIGQREIEEKKREEYYNAAIYYAKTALQLNPFNSESNCVMAIALGRTSMGKSGKEKISNAKEIKNYVERAILNDPANYKAWHVLGRWHFEISNLNFMERSIVKLLFGALPPASLTQSVSAFEKSREIAPGFVLNYYEMAKAYHHMDNDVKAIAYINHMLNLPTKTNDDPLIKEKGKALLKAWN